VITSSIASARSMTGDGSPIDSNDQSRPSPPTKTIPPSSRNRTRLRSIPGTPVA